MPDCSGFVKLDDVGTLSIALAYVNIMNFIPGESKQDMDMKKFFPFLWTVKPLSLYLGVHISKQARKVNLSQTIYINQILEQFQL